MSENQNKNLTQAESAELLQPVVLCPYCHETPECCDCDSPFWREGTER
jgi:hypothetical protein